MLRELDAARGETEAMLARQRRFVADASHELRTPLTSVLANLKLLADSLHGDQGDAANSALRSSRRMRRLVADLLLLARTDVGRVVAYEPCDLAQIVVEAAGELGPVSDAHDIELDVGRAGPVLVQGAHDELHRLTINLIENALRHTPPGSEIRVSTRLVGGQAELVVEDNGPGVPQTWRPPCSSALSAAQATAGARSASGWRSSVRWPSPTAARSGWSITSLTERDS